MNCYRENC